MRPRRPSSPLRGLLLFLLGTLVGANATYFLLTRDRDTVAPDGTRRERIETPLPIGQPASTPPLAMARGATTTTPAREVSAKEPPAPAAPLPAASIATTGDLLLPVQGVVASQLRDTFSDARSEGRRHDAIDIMAAAGTPVLAVADGSVEKLFTSKQGGLTLYQFNSTRTLAYYYAHLQGYAPGIVEKRTLRRGEVIGYVGSTGNASPQAPHLHFAIFVLGPEQQWWKGEAINPYPRLNGTPR